MWFRKAAEQNVASAQFNLGLLYETGQGVLTNKVTAHMWFNIAATKDHGGAVESRERVEGRITPQEISEAQHRAQRCMGSGYRDCD
jgi:TPR repeat protein